MNILFIAPNSPWESVGGVERYITNLIQHYKNNSQNNVHVIVPTSEQSKTKKNNNVTIYFEHSLILPIGIKNRQKIISNNAHTFSKLVEKIIIDEEIDAICAENFMFGPPAIYNMLLHMVASLHKVPIVLRLHSFAVTDLQIELINQLMWNRISCISRSVAGDCFKKETDIEILDTHYLGVDTNSFNTSTSQGNIREQLNLTTESKIVLTATRIVRGKKNILIEKGVINLIQAFSKICFRYPNLRLLIAVGTPPKILDAVFQEALVMLEGYIKLHGIEDQTIIKTFQMDQMPDVYKASDIFVLPSENETFGQVFLEAMSSGIPVIGTKVGGIPEIISDSYNGYLVQPNDASILAQKMERLLNNSAVYNKFKKAGIKTVIEAFTSERQFTKFHVMLEAIVSENDKKLL